MRFSSMCLSVVVGLAFIPAITSARVVDFPAGAIGISEETFQNVKAAHCYPDMESTGEEIPDSAVPSVDGELCDPVLAPLVNQVFFRAEHNGEMYTFITSDDFSGLHRYLPDGFYKAKGQLYWVANVGALTFRTRLGSGTDAYRRLLLSAQRNGNGLVTYMASTDLTESQQAKLAGHMVVFTDRDGELVYINATQSNDAYIVLTEANLTDWETTLGDELIITKKSLMKKLNLNNDWK